jgi:hypothetical protein
VSDNSCNEKASAPNPVWITEALIAETVEVWQPYYKQVLSRDMVIEILRSVGRLLDVLKV